MSLAGWYLLPEKFSDIFTLCKNCVEKKIATMKNMTGYDLVYLRVLIECPYEFASFDDRHKWHEQEATRLYLENPTHWDNRAKAIATRGGNCGGKTN